MHSYKRSGECGQPGHVLDSINDQSRRPQLCNDNPHRPDDSCNYQRILRDHGDPEPDEATKKLTASATSTVTVSGAIVPPSIALANAGPVTVTAGATSNNTSTLTLTSTGGFTGTAGLACAVTSSPAGANDPITCSLSSPSAALTGNSPYTALVYINSTASTTTTALKRGFETGGAMLAIVLIFIPARRRRLVSMVCVLALAFVAGSISGCSSGGSTNDWRRRHDPT